MIKQTKTDIMKSLIEVINELNWLGEVIDLQTIGQYQIATYKEKDFDTKEITETKCYTGYVNGEKIVNTSFSSLEACLVCNIATASGDKNGDAGMYFMKMIKNC